MDPVRPVKSGEKLSATWANTLVDVANMTISGAGVSEGAGGFSIIERHTADPQWLFVKPYTGTTLPKYHVGYVRDCTTTKPDVLTVEKSTGPFHRVYAVNGHTALASGVIGRGTLAKYRPAKAAYTGTNPQAGDELGPQPGTTYLKLGYQGFVAVSGGSGGYVKVLQVTERKPYIGKLDATLAGTADVNVSIFSAGTDSGYNITANPQIVASDIETPAGTWVVVDQPFGDGTWYLTNIIRPRVQTTAVVDVEVTNLQVIQHVRTLIVEKASTSTSSVVTDGTTCTAS